MTRALSTQTVASSTADWALWFPDAVGIIRWTVVFKWALTMRAQPTWVTLTNTTAEGPVAVATEGAVGLCLCLTLTTTGKIHRNLKGIFEAKRFDGKGATLLLKTAPQLSLNTEWHLKRKKCLFDSLCRNTGCILKIPEPLLTVSPILRPVQDLIPGMTSPFRQVALKERFNSSGTFNSSSSTLDRIFCSD